MSKQGTWLHPNKQRNVNNERYGDILIELFNKTGIFPKQSNCSFIKILFKGWRKSGNLFISNVEILFFQGFPG